MADTVDSKSTEKSCGFKSHYPYYWLRQANIISGRSSAWLERVVRVHEVVGSNPVTPTERLL